jgi:hypothetical protein
MVIYLTRKRECTFREKDFCVITWINPGAIKTLMTINIAVGCKSERCSQVNEKKKSGAQEFQSNEDRQPLYFLNYYCFSPDQCFCSRRRVSFSYAHRHPLICNEFRSEDEICILTLRFHSRSLC